ncbi:hypothetical protein T4A_4004 [Trichinella pseudospiralis]|uniref:Uncharacterized protein n=1 Tax=Trichinella pseudospiralis TaxID=6337 RepID=A0A0V1EY45_TRIPS|nr:hypothetical protein T4A_4004 [Trichinella pseudospiralis]KRZ44929.1 hypothetical protein T4C_13532 [Trichinella pseudospiralis]
MDQKSILPPTSISSQQQEDLSGLSRKNPAEKGIQENARRDQFATRRRCRVCSKASHIYCTKCIAFLFFSKTGWLA